MRNYLVLAGVLASTAALAHTGHGEAGAMHHDGASALNFVDPLMLVAAFAIVVAVATAKRR